MVVLLAEQSRVSTLGSLVYGWVDGVPTNKAVLSIY